MIIRKGCTISHMVSMETSSESAQIYSKTVLPNGLRVVSCEMPHTRSVTISVFVGVGSRYEMDEEAGISHFVEHMVFKGTKSRPDPLQISSAIEGTGGVINAGTDEESTVYWCKVAQPHFADSLGLLFEMLRESLNRQEDLETERRVIHEELAMANDYPSARVDMLVDEMLWPDHPLGRDVGGTKESVDGITRDMLQEFMSKHYAPSRVVVSVAGNVPHAQVVEQAESLSGDWANVRSDVPTPVTHMQSESQLRLEYRKTEQTHLSVAFPGLPLDHPDINTLDMLGVILGEGMSSRLFVELREKRGLVYDVHSGGSRFMDTGSFVISAGVDPQKVYEAIPVALEQVASMRDGVPSDEVERTKRLMAGRLMLNMEDTRSVSSWMGSHELMIGKVPSVDDVIARLDAITSDDVCRVARELLREERLNLAVVGPCRGRKRLMGLLRF